MKTIKLYGKLGKKYGQEHSLDVKSVSETIRALSANFPEFKSDFAKGKWQIFTSRKGRARPITMETLKYPFGRSDTLHIGPKGSMAGIEIGAALLIGALVVSAVAITVALLAPLPTAPDPNSREQEDSASAIADRPVNRIAQGHPVPVIYGEVVCGSHVVSSGIQTSSIQSSFFGSGSGSGFGGGAGGSGYVTLWGTDFHLFKGGKGGGGSTRAAQEDPNTLQSSAVVRTIELISVGPCVGLVDGLKSVFIDGTPVENADGTHNFPGFAIDVRVGDENQTHIAGFPGQEATQAKNVEISTAGGAIIHTISDPAIDSARVTLNIPALYNQNTENGDLEFHQVECDIEVQANGGGYTSIFTGNRRAYFSGKCTSPYQRDYSVALPAGGAPWDIRFSRVSPNNDAASVQDDTFLDFVTEITDIKLNWPGIAHVGITVDIKKFGSRIPTRSYRWKGLIVKVPTNYDPDTHTYTGEWDGTFKSAYTDDPAWCTYDLATNSFYGAGIMTQGKVDKWAFYAASKYCNELVPDGKGGMEPRYRVSIIIQSRAQALRLFNTMAGIFRASAYWGTEGLTLIQDRPELDIDKPLIVPANTGSDKIAYDEKGSEDQFSAVIVYWNDIDEEYALKPHMEPDNELMAIIGYEPKEITAIGAASKGQAARAARWEIEKQKNQNRYANIPVGPDQEKTNPGQILKVHDDRYTVGSMGGRINAATPSALDLDRIVDIDPARTYTISAMMPDGTTETRSLGSHSVIMDGAVQVRTQLVPATPFSSAPIVDGIWAIESDLVVLQQFKIQYKTEIEMGHMLRVEAHDPTSYARVEQGINIDPTSFSDLPSGSLSPVPAASITALEYQKIDGDSSVPSVRISWGASPDSRVVRYDAEISEASADGFVSIPGSDELSRDIVSIAPGDIQIRVRPVDSLGKSGPWRVEDFNIIAETAALPDVINLAVRADNEAVQTWLEWDIPTDTRPFKYEIFSGDPTDMANAVLIGQSSRRQQIITEPGDYFVRTAYMETRSSPRTISVVSDDLANPLWDRTEGRPLSLADLDAGSAGQIAANAQGVSDLVVIYGSTASAAQNASEALAAQSAAETAETNSQTAQGLAETAQAAAEAAEANSTASANAAATSASAAGASETAAGQSAASAQTSETNAATSAANASSSETAAALSETNAQGSASSAATSETNAANSANAAGASAGAAATSASTAQTEATNAGLSASAAATSAVTATTASDSAITASLYTFPSTMENPDLFFTHNQSGSPDAVPDVLTSNGHVPIIDPVEGPGIRTAGEDYISTKGVLPAVEGNTYYLRARVANPQGSTGALLSRFRLLNADYTSYGTGTNNSSPVSVNPVWIEKEYTVTASDIAGGARWVRAETLPNWVSGTGGGDQYIDTYALEFSDITDKKSAQDSASASAASAASAQASETAAGQSATAAQTAELNASTSAANALSSEGAAATSATNAAGSSAAAATSATNAANSESASGASASAAATSASSAATSATDASQFASAAQSDRLLAETARTGAETAQSASVVSANNASASEIAAAASATSSAGSATSASQSAAQASADAVSASQSLSLIANAASSVLPSSLVNPNLFFSNFYEGSPETIVDLLPRSGFAAITTADGTGIRVSGVRDNIAHKGVLSAQPLRKYRITVKVRRITAATTGDNRVRLGIRRLDSDYLGLGLDSLTFDLTDGDLHTFTHEYELPASNPAVYLRSDFRANNTSGSNAVVDLMMLAFEDVTAEATANITSSVVSSVENYLAAQHALTVGTGGQISGIVVRSQTTGDITTSDIKLSADKITLESGASIFALAAEAAKLTVPLIIEAPANGRITVLGSDFGADSNLTIWYGDERDLSLCRPSNALWAFDNEGRLYLGGNVQGSVPQQGSASGTTTATASLTNANGTDADITGQAYRAISETVINGNINPPWGGSSGYTAPTMTAIFEVSDNGGPFTALETTGTLTGSESTTTTTLQEPFYDPESGTNIGGSYKHVRSASVGKAFSEENYDTSIGANYDFRVRILSSSGSGGDNVNVQFLERGL